MGVLSRPSIIASIFSETGILRSLLLHREFNSIHRLLDRLLELGAIDRDSYEEFMDRLVELANLEGEEFEKKARELEGLIVRIMSTRKSENITLSNLHRLLDRLLELGAIDRDSYEEFMDRLVELANLEGEEFEKKARELKRELEGIPSGIPRDR